MSGKKVVGVVLARVFTRIMYLYCLYCRVKVYVFAPTAIASSWNKHTQLFYKEI